VVAGPLVRGEGLRRTVSAALAHTAAMLAGSAAVAAALLGMSRALGRAPVAVVAAVCVAAASAVALENRFVTPGSHWMVPRHWARLGPVGHSAAFGFLLGTGVATVLPSAAMYAVLVVAESAPRWAETLAVMLSFGAARALLVLHLTVRSALRELHPVAGLDRLRGAVRRAAPLEALLALALAVAVTH
jgi:hypothetical protein